MQSGDFWWHEITGPQTFVRQVTEILLEKRIPLLSVPTDLPWRHSMRNAVVELLTEKRHDRQPDVFFIDAADDCPANNIGEFLLMKFADRDTASEYRARSGRTLQQYLTAQGVLSNKIIWVKGLSPECVQSWLDFCREFESLSLDDGIFIIEIRQPVGNPSPDKFCTAEFVTFVTRYDVLLFNSILLMEAEQTLTGNRRGYIAVAAAYLCEFDAELSEALLQERRWMEENPCNMLKRLASNELFSRRGESRGSSHVLALLREGRVAEIMQRLWTAQIQVLFPLLEFQRIWIMQKLHMQLEDILHKKDIKQFEQKVCRPEELEFGALVFLMSMRHDNGDRWLYVPDENLRNAIYTLRDCRNTLAHKHQCCTPEQVNFILTFDEQCTQSSY